MKKIIYKLLLACLLLGNFVLQAQTIEQFSLCRKVESLNPIEPATQFDKGERAYCWLKVKDAKPNSFIFLDWYWEGKLQHAAELKLTYAAQRTYGYKTLSMNGQWKVAVRAADGRILHEVSFQAGTGRDVDPAEVSKGSTPVIVMNPNAQQQQDNNNSNSNSNSNNNSNSNSNSNANSNSSSNTRIIRSPQVPIANRAVQNVTAPITEKSRLLLPNVGANEAIPLVVMLPFTGGTAANLYSGYLYGLAEEIDNGEAGATVQFQKFVSQVSPNQPFALLLPAGAGSTADHSAEGFSNCILRYEQRVFADIQGLKGKMNISKVILCGYSLGGDLSWALMMRNPTLLDGALVMGSRCGYMESSHLPIMEEEGCKFFLFSGANEKEVRINGMKWAKWQLDKANIDYRYSEGAGLEHVPLPDSDIPEAFGFLLE